MEEGLHRQQQVLFSELNIQDLSAVDVTSKSSKLFQGFYSMTPECHGHLQKVSRAAHQERLQLPQTSSLTCTKDMNVHSVLYLTGQTGSQIQMFSEAISDASGLISVQFLLSSIATNTEKTPKLKPLSQI